MGETVSGVVVVVGVVAGVFVAGGVVSIDVAVDLLIS